VSNSPPSESLIALADAIALAVVSRIDSTRTRGAPNSSPLLTVSETCAYLNCARSTLNRLEAGGCLLPKRFGRKVLYARSDVDAYINDAGRAQAGRPKPRSPP
jgi:excisionase family DNA binding protein